MFDFYTFLYVCRVIQGGIFNVSGKGNPSKASNLNKISFAQAKKKGKGFHLHFGSHQNQYLKTCIYTDINNL